MFQKLVNRAVYSDFESIRSAYITAVKMKNNRRDEARTWIQEHLGYVELEDDVQIIDAGDYEYTTDGRVILRAQGKVWAISKEKYADIIAATRKQVLQGGIVVDQDAQSEAVETSVGSGTACTLLIDGQICGGYLSISSVCQHSALGRAGVAAIATCAVCGATFAIPKAAV